MIKRKDVLEVCSVLFITFILLTMLLISGCSQDKIDTKYYQTNYGEQCLYAPHIDSYKNLLFCYQENLSKEHSQNKLTNQ